MDDLQKNKTQTSYKFNVENFNYSFVEMGGVANIESEGELSRAIYSSTSIIWTPLSQVPML